MPDVPKGWFNPNNIGETLRNLIQTAEPDPEYKKTLTPDKFKTDLLDELKFLAPLSEEQVDKVRIYIEQNISNLMRLWFSIHGG